MVVFGRDHHETVGAIQARAQRSIADALANPNPDDDAEPHSAGAPAIHSAAQPRAVTRSIVSWAVRLVDTAKRAVSREALGSGLSADVVTA
jgi:hypothetical protein